jgi:outer membrane protein assembly factor BamB
MMHLFAKLLALMALSLATASAAADWPAFRGPQGDGTSKERGLPIKWGPKENVAWKIKLPGPGTSSPIAWGDRVFVTCYSGYPDPGTPKGDLTKLRRHLLCVDRKTGTLLWQRDIATLLPENEYNNYIAQHGYASSTPATDGERVYVFFGRSGVRAFDFTGKELWYTEVGKGLNSWGSAASTLLYRNLLLVNATVESGALLALEKSTGKQVWKAKGIRDCWSTPLLVELPGGKHEVVVNSFDGLLGLDPDKGERLWECEGIAASANTSSPVAKSGIVYVMGSGTGESTMMAMRAGGRGDVTKTHILWKQKGGVNNCSPVIAGDNLYWISGQVWCLKADTGKIVFQERLYPVRQEYASPVVADGMIYAFTRHNGCYVLKAGDRLEQLAHNDLDDRSDFNASPAISGGQFVVRSNDYLYCIGKEQR